MERIEFEDIYDLAEIMDSYVTSNVSEHEYPIISAYVDYKLAKSLVEILISMGNSIGAILELEDYEMSHYDKEYCIYLTEDGITCEKTFNDGRIIGKWLVIVDGTELDNTCVKKNDSYLERCYNKGTVDEYVRYHRSVLEAKIYFGDNLLASIGTEVIENSEEYQRKKYTEEQIKQDCESKAFIRLAAKIKKSFPRLPICIVADGLYVSEKVMNICKENDWDFIIRYKEGCAKSIEQEYKAIPEKEYAGDVEYVNEIVYKDGTVNFVKYKEKRVKKGEIITTEFKFITSLKINKTNAKKMVVAGRNRWKIENQGFNRQKNWQGNIEHACSHNERAQKNHYLMEQIADFIKQLYEYFYLLKNGIKKMQKNISSELLASLETQLIAEDTNDKHSLSQN